MSHVDWALACCIRSTLNVRTFYQQRNELKYDYLCSYFLSIDAICVCVLVDDVNVVYGDWTESWSSSMSSASKNKTKSWVSSWFLSKKVFSASTNQRQPASIVKAQSIPGIVTTFTVTSSGSLTSRKQKALIIVARIRRNLYVDQISSRGTCTSTCDATAFAKQTAAVR